MYLSIFLLYLGVVVATAKDHFLSDDFINQINEKQNTWTAGRNFDKNTPDSHIKALLGVKKRYKPRLFRKSMKILKDLPDHFDAREEWSQCRTVTEIRDQSRCGSCWAVAAVSAMSDRLCIASNGSIQVSLSASDLISCCKVCGYGCDGGFPDDAWWYWGNNGIVSGGGYGSNEGCKTYPFSPCNHDSKGSSPPYDQSVPTPECTRKCDENSTLVYENDLYFGKTSYSFGMDDEAIMSELYDYGPSEASFDVYEDFANYKKGVYQYTQGEFLGGHAVKLLGWGVENDVPYWLAANSWNENWGDKGYFKIRRGNNECGFGDRIDAGEAKFPQTD